LLFLNFLLNVDRFLQQQIWVSLNAAGGDAHRDYSAGTFAAFPKARGAMN